MVLPAHPLDAQGDLLLNHAVMKSSEGRFVSGSVGGRFDVDYFGGDGSSSVNLAEGTSGMRKGNQADQEVEEQAELVKLTNELYKVDVVATLQLFHDDLTIPLGNVVKTSQRRKKENKIRNLVFRRQFQCTGSLEDDNVSTYY